MSETTTSLADTLAYLDAARRRRVRRLAVVRTLWVGFVFSALCFYVDAVAALSGHLRLALSVTFTVVGNVYVTEAVGVPGTNLVS